MKRNLFFIFFVLIALAGCVGRNNQDNTDTNKEPTEADKNEVLVTQQMLDTLSLSEEVLARFAALDSPIVISERVEPELYAVCVENSLMTSPVSASELLSLSPINTLNCDSDAYAAASPREKDAMKLANRFMRMHYIAMGDADDEMQWAMATLTILNEHAAKYNLSADQALDDMVNAVDFLSAGTQSDINTYVYVMASVEYYKTIAAYASFLQSVRDNKLRDMLHQEYAAWAKMNGLRHDAYVYIRRANEWYTALPMELEGMYYAYSERRMELLETERAILKENKVYERRHPLVRTADWDTYMREQLDFREGADQYELAEYFDAAVKEWLAIRQKIARYLPDSKGNSYDNLTADYHWMIANDDEEIPSIFI